MIEFKSDYNPAYEINRIQLKILEIVEKEFQLLLAELQKASPVFTGELNKSWSLQINPAATGSEFSAVISNDAENAINRLEGRRPGRQPPSTALETWVQQKLGIPPEKAKQIAFVVSRKIGQQGSLRNPAIAFNEQTGEPVPGGIIDQAINRIESQINAIRL
jgi:hypothetical protein